MQEVGNELITLYEKTGVEPFRGVEHQGQLTPLQRYVIIETVNQNNRDKQQKVEEARNGGYDGVPNAAHGGGASSKQKEMLKKQYGEEDKSFVSKEYQDGDPPPLVVNDDEDE